MHNYNAQLETLQLKEYGRNVQKIANHIKGLDDEDKKSRMAHTLIGLMKQLNPNSKENENYDQMLWDHLYFITDLELEVKDSPYPKPATKVPGPPKKVPYTSGKIRFQHYGKNVEYLIEKAVAMTDAEEKENATIHIARIMKRFYMTWNKDSVEDSVILKHLKMLSQDQLTFDLDKVKEANLLFIQRDARSNNGSSYGRNHSNNNNRGRRNHSNNNNRRRR